MSLVCEKIRDSVPRSHVIMRNPTIDQKSKFGVKITYNTLKARNPNQFPFYLYSYIYIS